LQKTLSISIGKWIGKGEKAIDKVVEGHWEIFHNACYIKCSDTSLEKVQKFS